MAALSFNSPNFGFLAKHDFILVKHAALAERYVFDDANSSLIKLRQFAELLAEHCAAYSAVSIEEQDSFLNVLDKLWNAGVLGAQVSQLFHGIRKAGNDAVHTRPVQGRNIAIAEWPTKNGPADYLLFVGLRAVASIEAKKFKVSVASRVDQAARYSKGFQTDLSFESNGGPWREYHLPFAFASNGRPYLPQIKEQSGVWFHDIREATKACQEGVVSK